MTPMIRTVASYSTHQEYSVDFFGDELIVTVTPTASVISRWISDVLLYNRHSFSSHPLVVGVGVQWTPVGYYSDTPPHSYYADPPPNNYYTYSLPNNYYADLAPGDYYTDPPADTLQLCVGKRCLIIQLSHCDNIPDDLRSFLADPETKFVGVWNSQDARKLERSTHELEIGELHDIRHYVNDSEGMSLSRCSFEEIVQECMGYQGVRLDRDISMSDWSVFNLFHDQILQASLDVYVCSELGVWVRLWEL